MLAVVETEAQEIADKFGRDRSTVMSTATRQVMSVEDIIPNEQSLIVFSRKGYVKRMHAATFSVQHRGGKGKACLVAFLLHLPCVFKCVATGVWASHKPTHCTTKGPSPYLEQSRQSS